MKINAQKLKAAREKAGITRAELAITADLSHVRIWQLELDGENNINDNIARAIARKLKVQVFELQ